MSKKWFAVLIAAIGLYEIIWGLVFFVATPVLTSLQGFMPDTYSTYLGQQVGGALIGLGILEVVSARDLDRWLVIPVMGIFGRFLTISLMGFYVAIGVFPLILMLPFMLIEGGSAFVVLVVILWSKDYSIRQAFGL